MKTFKYVLCGTNQVFLQINIVDYQQNVGETNTKHDKTGTKWNKNHPNNICSLSQC